MRLLISAVTFDEYLRSGMSQLELVPLADKYGCVGVEFRPYWNELWDEIGEIIDLLAEYHLGCTYACNEALLAASPEETRQSLAAMEESIEIAARLGSPLLRINTASGPFPSEYVHQEWWQQAVRKVLSVAELKNVVLAIENAPNTIGGNVPLIRDIITLFESPWLKATYDTGNSLIAGFDPGQALDMLIRYVGYVHLKDIIPRPERMAHSHPGTGVIDIKALVAKLEQSGYQGLYALEFPGGNSPANNIRSSMQYFEGIREGR